MHKTITFKGAPLTLAGRGIKLDSPGPDFTVIGQALEEIRLDAYAGKIKLVTSFPSLDTPVCDAQVKKFNLEAAGLSADLVILGISKDLPFAQKRFCDSFDIKNIVIASDYKFSSFGINYGLLIKELNLLARAVIILDRDNIIRYVEIAGELTHPPDYPAALKALSSVVDRPQGSSKDRQPPLRCLPCETATAALPREKIDGFLGGIPGWQLVEDRKLIKELKFNDFIEAKYFLDLLSVVAREQGHHPIFTLSFNKLKITLTTHASGGLTENDFIMARIIDDLYGN